MDKNSIYFKQVRLLVGVLPIVAQEKCFALKGGTAINLFVRNLPRLSVDIDLTYLPMDNRKTALVNIDEALNRICAALEGASPQEYTAQRQGGGDSQRILVSDGAAQIKIELSPVLRGTVFEPEEMQVTEDVEDMFGYAEINIVSFADLYGGKICAALDRQHPRDLFDIKLLLENEGLGRELIQAFLVYLISHPRPISEIISPRLQDITEPFKNSFDGMTDELVTQEELEEAREQLIAGIHKALTDDDKRFLLSFKSGEPDWDLLAIDSVENLPAVKWKLMNIRKLKKNNAKKHEAAFKALEDNLS